MPYPATELYEIALEKQLIQKDVWLEFAKNPSVASRIKWRNIAPQFIVTARRNFISIVVLCEKSCNAAGAIKGKQDASVES